MSDESQLAQWPDLPIYERDPTKTCATCEFLVRLRQGPSDIQGAFVCKRARPSITSLPQPSGVVGISSDFVPQHPWQWCFDWIPRSPAVSGGSPGAKHRLRLVSDPGGNPEVEKPQLAPNPDPNL